MKKIFLILLLAALSTNTAFADSDINFRPLAKHNLLMESNSPQVYMPSRLLIGDNSTFTIKADAGSHVLLAVSDQNTGASSFHGQVFNLGASYTQKEGIVPENGLLQLNYQLPNDKKLENKTYYFEVFVWKSEDFADLKKAKVMGPNGRETDSNEITAIIPTKNASGFRFGPDMPGMPGSGQEFMNTVDKLQSLDKKNNTSTERDYDVDDSNIYTSPVLIRNLNAPDINQGNK